MASSWTQWMEEFVKREFPANETQESELERFRNAIAAGARVVLYKRIGETLQFHDSYPPSAVEINVGMESLKKMIKATCDHSKAEKEHFQCNGEVVGGLKYVVNFDMFEESEDCHGCTLVGKKNGGNNLYGGRMAASKDWVVCIMSNEFTANKQTVTDWCRRIVTGYQKQF